MNHEALYTLPDDGFRHELQAGCVVSEPPTGFAHGDAAGRVAAAIGAHARATRSGRLIVAEAGFLLASDPDTVRCPDVAFVSASRLALVRDGRRAFPGPPDLAVEVVSPSNSPGEMHAKVADYLAAGSKLVWVVDPETKTVAVYRTLLAPRFLGADDVLDGEDVVPGFTLPVAEIFEP
ncbi:MAG TPA: Uma2 family endonuclease [Candidatus Polarisedimenticolaceae bacterium]